MVRRRGILSGKVVEVRSTWQDTPVRPASLSLLPKVDTWRAEWCSSFIPNNWLMKMNSIREAVPLHPRAIEGEVPPIV